MRVCLASINFRPLFDPVTGRNSHEWLALKCLAACALRQGHEVKVVDAQFRDLSRQAALAEIFAFRPDVVGLSLTDWVLEGSCDWVRRIRRAFPEAFLCAGGPGPTSWDEELLRRAAGLDAVIRGEGEATFCDLLESLAGGRPFQTAPGISFLDGSGRLSRTGARPFIDDLDSLPFALREPSYPLNSATLYGSRGCFANCSFCAVAEYSRSQPGRTVRFRSPEHVVEEMFRMYRDNGVRWFNFVDDVFTGVDRLRNGWVEAIAQGILDRGMQVSLFCESRADDIYEETLLALKRAGLKTIAIGIESGSERALRTFRKGLGREKNSQAIRLVQRHNIHYELFSILVEADTTPEELLADIGFFVDHNYLQQNDPIPFSLQVLAFKAYPFRHTALYRAYQERGILRENGFSIAYDLQNPALERISEACAALHQRIPEALSRGLNFSYVAAIQSGDLAPAVAEKRFGNRFLAADLKFMRALLGRVLEQPGPSEAETQRLVEAAAAEINAIHADCPSAAVSSTAAASAASCGGRNKVA